MKASALIILLMDQIEKRGDLDVCHITEPGDRDTQSDVNAIEVESRDYSGNDDLVFVLI